MPPRLNIWGVVRPLAMRPGPSVLSQPAPRLAALARPCPASSRLLSDSTTQPPRIPEQPQASSLDSTLSPAAPISSEFAKNLPSGAFYESEEPSSFPAPESDENAEALRQLHMAAYGLQPYEPDVVGHKYGLPELPLAKDNSTKFRYAPMIVQTTRLLMKDGKLGKAQRDMAMILNYLRTSPPPKYNPLKPLVPGAPPPAHLPLDPVLYLTLAVDSVAPLVRNSHIKGAAGGGQALPVPHPLTIRQRRRIGFQWILEAAKRRPNKGSGRTMFPHRVGEEIVAVVEGRSGAWDKRLLFHKQSTAARANLNHMAVTGRKHGK